MHLCRFKKFLSDQFKIFFKIVMMNSIRNFLKHIKTLGQHKGDHSQFFIFAVAGHESFLLLFGGYNLSSIWFLKLLYASLISQVFPGFNSAKVSRINSLSLSLSSKFRINCRWVGGISPELAM